MAETRCESCLYYGTCTMTVDGGCDDFVNEESYVEMQREEYRNAFRTYINSFEND